MKTQVKSECVGPFMPVCPMNGTAERMLSDSLLLAQACIVDREFSKASKALKTADKALKLIEGKPILGQVVFVNDGPYIGCVLTFIGTDWLTGKPICHHSEHLGGLRCDSVTPYQA